MRQLIDKIFRAGIKLCMLTGVSFLVTACYGTPYMPEAEQEAFEQEVQQMEQQIQNNQPTTNPSNQ